MRGRREGGREEGATLREKKPFAKRRGKHRGGIVTTKPAESIVREKVCVCSW